jgi:hypothetical protein
MAGKAWNPYAGLPDHWNHRNRESESEGELQVSKIDCDVQPETMFRPNGECRLGRGSLYCTGARGA